MTRTSEHEYRREDLGAVVFVPLIGEHGWAEAGDPRATRGTWLPRNPGPLLAPNLASRPSLVSKLIAECAEPIGRIEDVTLDAMNDRIGDSDAGAPPDHPFSLGEASAR